ncbi:zinc finger protein 276-like isoform X9 [Xenopus laevis]|uniref:Zinc finger protein 276-like isoform X9 n=1 Tax=Xenopus laevis TaxID=8355 RepID=A0A8J1MWV0_XENLA|nr:zinc finger protein 276-like isoform X9 [Xenopus laevis]
MASTHGDVALRPLQRAMKLANRAIQLDTGNWGGTAYKFPYQGCTAVYRGSDDMKKHIKEHHEEVRERPCPHPGCNKVFMIDQYLQRHVKLIHTEERNHICDQCRQAFKQQKHLSVHQGELSHSQ